MGLGGFVVVAAFVMTFEAPDSGSKVVPVTDDPTTTDGSLLTSLLVEEKKDKQNGPSATGPYLCVPNTFDLPDNLRKPSVTLSNNKPSKTPASAKEEAKIVSKSKTIEVKKEKEPVKSTTKETPKTVVNGPQKGPRPPPSLPITGPGGRMRNRELMMMQLCLDEFVPSPQDIEIMDPDGCDTPRGPPDPPSMDMEVYVSSCPITVRVQVEPRHLASMESDGLSDSDISDPGEIARISRRDMDYTEQQRPLLGRCSPALSSPELRRVTAPSALLKRDSTSRRFPLLRQGALDGHTSITGHTQTTLA